MNECTRFTVLTHPLMEIILKIAELLSQIRVQSAHFVNVLDNHYLSQ